MKSFTRYVALVLLLFTLADSAIAQRGPGRGFGRGPGGPGGRGRGPGAGHDDRHQEDHNVFHFLLTNHEKISRTVKELPNGVETVTESDDPEVTAKIQDHVKWMQHRVEETLPIRMRDPLFAEIFKHTDRIVMVYEKTDKGVRVTETSDDPYVAKLIKAHAKTVSGFVERGFREAMKNHPVPEKDTTDAPKQAVSDTPQYHNPVIKEYGKVVQFPHAAHQPREGSRVVVDLTRGGEPGELNGGIEKVCRFVNIYAGAGNEPAQVSIAVVLHGDATLTILNDDAYSKRFETDGNPNLACLHELHEAGVEIYVCGQSLTGKGGKAEDVVVFADVAVSGLTALVNLQADNYAYVPLGN